MKRRRSDSAEEAEEAGSSATGDFVRGRKPRSAEESTRGDVSLVSSSDFLFSKSQAARKEKKRAKKQLERSHKAGAAADAIERTAAGVARLTSLPKSVEPLSFKSIQAGDKALAVVRSVTRVDAVLSLPNGLTAYVKTKDVSDYFHNLDAATRSNVDLRDVLTAGSFIRCAISKLSGSPHSRVDVTTRASVVNGGVKFEQLGPDGVSLISGHIQSVEDRGYIVDLGLKNAKGFLPFDKVAGASDTLFATGTPVNVVVTKIQTKSRVATLSCDPAVWASSAPTVTT